MAFEGAGQEEGLAIWRIEVSLESCQLTIESSFYINMCLQDFAPVPYDEQKYGKFNVGDSYIVLNTRV